MICKRLFLIPMLTFVLVTSIYDSPKGGLVAKEPDSQSPVVPDPIHGGGEAASMIQVANLVYAGSKSSECFADHFLIRAENESTISTSRRFHAVKLSSTEIYDYPLLIMTGEGEFVLNDSERTNLLAYLKRGGFLLASAGCSSTQWDRSFRREISNLFDGSPLEKLEMTHPIFHTVNDIEKLTAKHGEPKPLEGVSLGDRLAVLYSQDGLNDTSHSQGCCCCGGNEITNAELINVNILAYTVSY